MRNQLSWYPKPQCLEMVKLPHPPFPSTFPAAVPTQQAQGDKCTGTLRPPPLLGQSELRQDHVLWKHRGQRNPQAGEGPDNPLEEGSLMLEQ